MRDDVKRQRLRSWHEEMTSAYLYAVLAAKEEGRRRTLFESLGQAARHQAELWIADMEPPPPFVPPWRARLTRTLLQCMSPRQLLPVLAALKVRGLGVYRTAIPDVPELELDASDVDTPLLSAPAEQARHRAGGGGGALRAAVFGVNDGLISNTSLILGMAGATADPAVVVLAGAAGLLAGGFSMAAGEYISVRTQREVYEKQIALEWEEILEMPEEEIAELTEIYVARGLPREQAASVARKMIGDPARGLVTLAREELGLDPESLGSPWGAAGASFVSFAVGAAIPLVPFAFTQAPIGLWLSMAFSLLALLGVGSVMSLFTGRGTLWSALRMGLIGSAAAAATFVIGRYFGIALS